MRGGNGPAGNRGTAPPSGKVGKAKEDAIRIGLLSRKKLCGAPALRDGADYGALELSLPAHHTASGRRPGGGELLHSQALRLFVPYFCGDQKTAGRMLPEKICGCGAGRTAGKRMAAGRKIRFHFLYRQRFRGEACHGKGCEIPDAGNAGTGREKPLCGGSVGGYFLGGEADRLRQMAQLRPDLRGPGLRAHRGGGKGRISVRPPVLDGENVRKISVRQSRMGKDH